MFHSRCIASGKSDGVALLLFLRENLPRRPLAAVARAMRGGEIRRRTMLAGEEQFRRDRRGELCAHRMRARIAIRIRAERERIARPGGLPGSSGTRPVPWSCAPAGGGTRSRRPCSGARAPGCGRSTPGIPGPPARGRGSPLPDSRNRPAPRPRQARRRRRSASRRRRRRPDTWPERTPRTGRSRSRP